MLFKGVSISEALGAWQRRFGNVFQFWLGVTRLIVISGSRDVEHIFTHRNIYDQGDSFTQALGILIPNALMCIKGQKYRRHLSISGPLFRHAKIISNLDLIIDKTDKLLSKWRNRSSEIVHLDIVKQCQKLSLDIFGFIGFDYDLQTLDDDNDLATNDLARSLQDILDLVQKVFRLPTVISTIYLKFNQRYQRSRLIVEQYCNQMKAYELTQSPELIAQRKRTSLIASLISSLSTDEQTDIKENEEGKKGLYQSELFDEMIFFLLAGFETVATAVSWFIFHISKHPQIQEKIKAELNKGNDVIQPLTLDYLDSLIYLDAVVNEVLRYTSPSPGTYRTLTADDRLPESGVQLYKGDQVFISITNLARDPQNWSIDSDIFCPERFLDGGKPLHPYAFIPFGGGHRQCLGQDLARFELKVIAARLMQYVTFGDGGPEVNSGGEIMTITLMPKHLGVTIKFD